MKKSESLENYIQDFIQQVNKSQIMMADDKNEMLEDNIGFKKTLGDKIENFINVTAKELKDEAFRL